VFTVPGLEFGTDLAEKQFIVDEALYGLKSSSIGFHEHFSVKLRKLDFLPSKADLDLWKHKSQGETYKCMARFVDDVIIFSKKLIEIIGKLKMHCIMKGVEKP
jgi:hypothetical protein